MAASLAAALARNYGLEIMPCDSNIVLFRVPAPTKTDAAPVTAAAVVAWLKANERIWTCEMGADLVRLIPHYGNRPEALTRRVPPAVLAALQALGADPLADPACVARREAVAAATAA